MGLKEARERKADERRLLADGCDPGIEATKANVEQAKAAANTFEVVARTWYDLQKNRWTPIHSKDVLKSLENEVFPWIGSLPVHEIDEPIVLAVLRKIEERGAIEAAHRVR